jgi:hypothetical protein
MQRRSLPNALFLIARDDIMTWLYGYLSIQEPKTLRYFPDHAISRLWRTS